MEKLLEYKHEICAEIEKELECNMCKYCEDFESHMIIQKMLKTIYYIDKVADGHHSHANMYAVSDKNLTQEMAKDWCEKMNPPAKWTMQETSAVANRNGVVFTHITAYCWWVAMNKMWSDHYATMSKYGVTDVNAYADLAKDWLFDADSAVTPKEKLAITYHELMKK